MEDDITKILFELKHGKNFTGTANLKEINEAKSAILTKLDREIITNRKTKDPSGYVNEPELRAWQDGYNRCVSDVHQRLQSYLRGEK